MSFWRFRDTSTRDRSGSAGPQDREGDDRTAVLDIEGELVVEEGWWSGDGTVVARDFRKALDQVGDVIVRINSPGGDVLAGSEIYNALREHSTSGKGRVTVHVTALAASAASVVAMAGDEVLMNPTAYMMIHDPWSMAMGNADDLRQLADQLDEIGEGIVEAYALKTGKSKAKLRELMDAETYMSAPTAIREGFADGLLYQPAEGEEPAETEMAASAVASRMVARIREGVKNGSTQDESLRNDDALSCRTGPSHAHSAAQDDRATEQLRREEIARRAEIVARSTLVSGEP